MSNQLMRPVMIKNTLLFLLLATSVDALAFYKEIDVTFANGKEKRGYRWCENEPNDTDDWLRGKYTDFCRFRYRKHKNYFLNGFERDRLTGRCIFDGGVADFVAYECYDESKDPDVIGIRAVTQKRMNDAYEDFKGVYRKKVENILQRVQPQVADLNANIKLTEQTAQRTKEEISRLNQNKENVTRILREIEDVNQKLQPVLVKRNQVFADLYKEFTRVLALDADDIGRLQSWIDDDLKVIRSPQSDEVLITNTLQKIQSYEKSCRYRVCSESRGYRKLLELRRHQALSNFMFDNYLNQMERYKSKLAQSGFKDISGAIDVHKDKMNTLVNPYYMIFSQDLDRITLAHKSCDLVNKTYFAAQLRLEIESIDQDKVKLARVLAEFDQKMQENESRFNAKKDALALERSLSSIAAKFNKNLGRSQWSEAQESLRQSEEKLLGVISKAEANKSFNADQISLLKDKAQKVLKDMQKEQPRLQWPNANMMVKRRYENFSNRMLDLWESNPQDETKIVLESLYQNFKTKVGNQLAISRPKNIEEMADLDAQLSAAEELLNTVTKENL
jgi:hypothetical protein